MATRRTLPQLQQLLEHPNIRAFAHVIREGESNHTEAAFGLVVYGGTFSDFSDHPRKHFDRERPHTYRPDWRQRPPNSTTSAAGAFQITETTWNNFRKAMGYTGAFDAAGQTLCMAWLIDMQGAIDEILAADLPGAIALLRTIWTSLPGAAENNARYSMSRAIAVFRAYGGKYPDELAREAPAAPDSPAAATIPPTPPSPPAAPAAPAPDQPSSPPAAGRLKETIAMSAENPERTGSTDWIDVGAKILGTAASVASPLLGALVAAFSPLAQEKIRTVLANHTDNPDVATTVAKNLMDVAVTVTNQPNQLQAVAAIQADPDLAQRAEAAALDVLEKLTPLLNKLHEISKDEWSASETSMEAAAARAKADPYDPAKLLTRAGLYGVGALIVLVGSIVVMQTWRDGEATTMSWAALTGLIGWATSKLGDIFAYRFGTNRQSAAKDETINQLSKVR